jgi:protocatechuate 3,4-dioxygenase beta subunit
MDGQRSESIVASVATDDRGEYRLYWLPPGQYHVAATPQDVRRGWVPVIPKSLSSPGGFYTLLSTPDVMRRVVDGGQIQEEVQVAAYFPGTTSLEEASLIEVSGGANIAGMNIIVAPPKPVQRIRGILINAATGQPIRDGTVRVMPLTNSGNVMGLGMGKSDRDGRFEIHGLLPGSYVLTAMANSGGDRADLDGEVPVTVGANDLENISIPLSTGVDIPVSIRIEGSPVGAGVTFRLRSVPTQPFPGGSMFMRPGTPQWNLLNTRQFTIEGLRPGTYRFSFVPMGGGGPGATLPVYVKSITLGTADVLNGLLRIDGPVEQPLQMTLSANVSILEGVVLDQRQEPVPNVSVAVIPDAPYRGRADLYATGITDAGGRFRIGGIAPGNYRVFSWETVEGWSWLDPEWLRPYEGRGRSLHFEEGSRDNIQLTVIRD